MVILLINILTLFVGCQSSKTEVDELPKEIVEVDYSEGFQIKSNIVFYVFEDEYFENNDINNPNTSQLTRVFTRYDGVKNDITPYTNTVFLDKVNSIQEFREALFLKEPSELKLPPNTIVSGEVLKNWELQNYDGINSYSDESPIGLTYSELQ